MISSISLPWFSESVQGQLIVGNYTYNATAAIHYQLVYVYNDVKCIESNSSQLMDDYYYSDQNCIVSVFNFFGVRFLILFYFILIYLFNYKLFS